MTRLKEILVELGAELERHDMHATFNTVRSHIGMDVAKHFGGRKESQAHIGSDHKSVSVIEAYRGARTGNLAIEAQMTRPLTAAEAEGGIVS